MYKIIGADGKEYGPISLETLKQWIVEGRANQHTRIQAEGSGDWKALSEFPELAAALPPGSFGTGAGPSYAPPSAAPPMQQFPAATPDALTQVNGPGIGLIVVGALSLVIGLPSLVMHLAGFNFMPQNVPPEAAWVKVMMGPLGVASNLLTLALGALIIFGGIKMRALQNYGLVMTAAILAVIPCTTSCCLVGIPVGVWALVVLFKPEVKSAFH